MDQKRIAITFLIVLTNTIGATVILPMMPLYIEKQFGATVLQATLVIAAFYAAQIVAAPWLGKLSDRLGRRPILIISQIGTLIAYLMFVFAAQLGAGFSLGISGGLVVIYLARIIDGLTGGNVSVAEAYASDISDEKSRTQALGLIGGASGVGHILGPALAVLLSRISLLAPIIGAAVMSGVTLLLTIILLDETLPPEKRSAHKAAVSSQSIKQLLASRPILLVLSTAFAIGLYIAAVMSSFSLYAERALFPNEPAEVVAQNSGLLLMLMGLGVALIQIVLIGPIVKRLGEQVVVVLGGVLLLASAIGFGSATSATTVALPILAYAFGFAICWPSLQSIISRLSSKETVGQLLGLFQSAFSLALIVAPIGAGLILESSGPRAVFYNGAWLLGLATVLGVIVMHLAPPSSDGESVRVEVNSDPDSFLKRFHH